jgi:hypothetical protein
MAKVSMALSELVEKRAQDDARQGQREDKVH